MGSIKEYAPLSVITPQNKKNASKCGSARRKLLLEHGNSAKDSNGRIHIEHTHFNANEEPQQEVQPVLSLITADEAGNILAEFVKSYIDDDEENIAEQNEDDCGYSTMVIDRTVHNINETPPYSANHTRIITIDDEKISTIGKKEEATSKHCNNSPCLLQVVDVCIAFLVVFPLVIFFWRGTWDLWDYFCALDCTSNQTVIHTDGMEHENYDSHCLELRGNWISCLAGIAFCCTLNCFSPVMDSAASDCSRGTFYVTSRLYSYAYAIAYLGQWRGTWNLVDAYSGGWDWQPNLVGLSMCITVMYIFRIHRHWTSSPWCTVLDTDPDIFLATPWFHTKVEQGMWKYSVDVILSQVICVNLNITTWRCLWNVLDEVIFPSNHDLSAICTLAFGAGMLLVMIILLKPLTMLSTSLNKNPARRSLLDGTFYVIVNTNVVCMWRGFWNLIAKYMIPDQLTGGIVCHVIGTVGLMATMSFRSVYDNSVDLDGASRDGEGLQPDMVIVRKWKEHRERKKKGEISWEAAKLPITTVIQPTHQGIMTKL